MAVKLNLQPNEKIILKDSGVAHGGIMAVNDDEIILTTLNIIHINKGLFGNTKGVTYYPLNQLKQAIQGKHSNGIVTLELYFMNGVESFNFNSVSSKKIKKWITAINDVKGATTPYYDLEEDDARIDPNSLAGQISEIGKQFKDVGDEFRAAFGFKPKSEQSPKSIIKGTPTQISKKCIGCSAPLTGKVGQVVRCKYCDTDQTL